MANLRKRLESNSSGFFYVDSSCIDCGACRFIAPKHYKTSGGYSCVYRQPLTQFEKNQCHQALLSCPTSSIGFSSKIAKAKPISLPQKISKNIWHLGYHSESSFGGASYFIRRKKGNILIDCPRFNLKVKQFILEMGGADYQLFTHKDDLADYKKFFKNFRLYQGIHEHDWKTDCGEFVFIFKDRDVFSLFSDLKVIPTPGHTKGHICYLYRDEGMSTLFTGDHLSWSHLEKSLRAFHTACWYSWSKQIESMERLLRFDFDLVLPGHGGAFKAPPVIMKRMVSECISWMKSI